MAEASLTPDRRIAIASAPQGARHAFAALLGLDQRLGDIVRAARDPMIGQMRLTWWHEALGRLDSAPAPAEPLLRDLATHVVAGGIRGAMLADLVEGWEVLLDEATNQESLGVYARGRGGLLFDLGTRLLRSTAEPYVGAAGRAWALADLANGSADGRVVEAARGTAAGLSRQAFAHRWPAPIRPLGILAKLAIAGGEPGNALAKSMAIARFRLMGRSRIYVPLLARSVLLPCASPGSRQHVAVFDRRRGDRGVGWRRHLPASGACLATADPFQAAACAGGLC